MTPGIACGLLGGTMKYVRWLSLGVVGMLAAGCSTSFKTDAVKVSATVDLRPDPPPHDTLYATVWVQAASEYRALSRQAYVSAAAGLEAALADPTWTAAVEQAGQDVAALPPAIIVDVDETVLDNAPFQARVILDDASYSESAWAEWVQQAAAEPVPGAVEFLQAASARGVTVFYVTNRAAQDEAATERNLRACGFPFPGDRDVLLMKGENDWPSDKTSRRALIGREFRIVLLCGDDLNDFISGARASAPGPRDALAERYADWFGRRWIVLPNPVYGSWEASLYGRDYSLSPEEKRARIRGYLRPPAE